MFDSVFIFVLKVVIEVFDFFFFFIMKYKGWVIIVLESRDNSVISCYEVMK